MSRAIMDIQKGLIVDENSIQLLVLQIHIGYGGSDLENWLEAEEILKNKKSFSQEQVTMA